MLHAALAAGLALALFLLSAAREPRVRHGAHGVWPSYSQWGSES